MNPPLRPLCIALILSSALLVMCSAGEPAGGETADPALEVMSFNLRWGPDPPPNGWHSRRKLITALLREQAPDVIGFQESRGEYIDALLPHLPEYEAYPPDGERQNTILYHTGRLRLDRATSDAENSRQDVPDADWGPGSVRLPRCARLIEKQSGAGFYVYNNHLDHRSAPSRQWSVAVLIDRIRARKLPDPVILIGDFNANAKEPALRFLRGESPQDDPEAAPANPVPFIDAYRSVHPDEVASGTYHGFLGVRLGPRVDYVFVQPDVRVLDARIIHSEWNGNYPSDHFPVIARVLLPSGSDGR